MRREDAPVKIKAVERSLVKREMKPVSNEAQCTGARNCIEPAVEGSVLCRAHAYRRASMLGRRLNASMNRMLKDSEEWANLIKALEKDADLLSE